MTRRMAVLIALVAVLAIGFALTSLERDDTPVVRDRRDPLDSCCSLVCSQLGICQSALA